MLFPDLPFPVFRKRHPNTLLSQDALTNNQTLMLLSLILFGKQKIGTDETNPMKIIELNREIMKDTGGRYASGVITI